ncbi:MAG TPA: LPS assembly lipoprotein LptE [Vineibacter sp.]|nr:LPS assembly lipoprotein LptE [Vineibacter sp.]
MLRFSHRSAVNSGSINHLWVVLALASSLAACGFEPMYGERAGTTPADRPAQTGVQSDMFATRVATIADRVGQMVRNQLVDRLNPQGEPGQPAYYLVVRLNEQKDAVLTRSDEFSTATNLRLIADFEVRDPKGNILNTGYSRAITRYNTLRSQYATIAAEDSARERAARELAEDIRVKLAVFYAHRRGL